MHSVKTMESSLLSAEQGRGFTDFTHNDQSFVGDCSNSSSRNCVL